MERFNLETAQFAAFNFPGSQWHVLYLVALVAQLSRYLYNSIFEICDTPAVQWYRFKQPSSCCHTQNQIHHSHYV